MKPSPKEYWKSFLIFNLALSALALYQTEEQTQALLKIRFRYKWVVVIAVFAANFMIGAYLLRREKFDSIWERLDFKQSNIIYKIAGVVLFLAAFPILWYAKFDFYGKAVPAFFPLMWIMWWLAIIQTTGLKLTTRLSWAESLMTTLIVDGIVYQIYSTLLSVTDYPFSLGWSEASRFYYGSLPFSRSIYGVQLPLSIWHGTRYLLLSIPFLIKGLPLWADRLWQALLWIGLTGLASWSLVRRVNPQSSMKKLLIGGWFFLYSFQGAVYYHLQVCVIIIFLGVSRRHFWRSLLAVLIASFWAGMSRLNWYPVPAMLAIALYLLEEPFSNAKNFRAYIFKPALWAVLGLATAILGQTFYIYISGNQDLKAFGSSLTSQLLFYRWLPSDTNALGILPGILIVSSPLFALLFWTWRGRLANVHPLRWIGLFAMSLVLFAGGLIVSAKIGGGGDLHNMDAFMVLLALIAVYSLDPRVETEAGSSVRFDAAPWFLIVFMVFVPICFSLSRVAAPFRYDQGQAAKDLSTLRASVQSYAKSGEILFIYERHLQTFGMIPNVPLVKDYEVLTLMEMAISGNQPYLNRFYRDLENHRFAAIVARKQNLDASTGDFAEESAGWNHVIAYYLLCEYEPVLTLESSNVQVFVPRRVRECPSFQPTDQGTSTMP